MLRVCFTSLVNVGLYRAWSREVLPWLSSIEILMVHLRPRSWYENLCTAVFYQRPLVMALMTTGFVRGAAALVVPAAQALEASRSPCSRG